MRKVELDPNPSIFAMAPTPFTTDNKVDEPALRAHLRRMVEGGCDVYMGSGGVGEGHVLTPDELKQVYEIGVEEGKGKIKVYANPREARSAGDMLQIANIASAAGIEVVQLYPVDAGHGMRPTYTEQEVYYRTLLDAIDYPTSISIHVAIGYITPADLVARLTHDYPLIRELNVMGPPMSYFVELRDQVRPDVKLNAGIIHLLDSLALGANGCLCAEPNIIPKVCRAVVDNWVKGDQQSAGEAMANVIRFGNIVNQWAPSTARWIKMALKVLDLPGGNGMIREPYVLPSEADQKKMGDQFAAMGLKQLEGLP